MKISMNLEACCFNITLILLKLLMDFLWVETSQIVNMSGQTEMTHGAQTSFFFAALYTCSSVNTLSLLYA
jgi:hypothetical protein